MRSIMRVVIGLVGLFNLAVGIGFLFVPQQLAAAFFLSPIGTQGMATLRADFPGFFIGASVFALLGAWRADARLLLVPMLMLGLALTGRVVSIALDGMAPTAIQPMVVEVVMLALLLVARRSFAQRA